MISYRKFTNGSLIKFGPSVFSYRKFNKTINCFSNNHQHIGIVCNLYYINNKDTYVLDVYWIDSGVIQKHLEEEKFEKVNSKTYL